MRHLCIVTELYDPSIGGQEIRYKEWSQVFLKKGWKVTILTIDHTGLLPGTENMSGVRVHRLVKDKNYVKQGAMPRNLLTVARFTYALQKFFNDNKIFDCVMFNQWPVLPQVLVKMGDKKCVHDWCELSNGFFWRIVQKILTLSMKKHICVSPGIKDRLTSEYGVKHESILTVESGINVQEYKGGNSKRDLIIFFGRLSPHKHPDQAVEAVRSFNAKHARKEKIVVVGGGPMYQDLLEKYQHDDCVQCLGKISDEKKMEVLQRAKINILPSEREGFPRTVAECMAFGVPTVTTNYPNNGTTQVVEMYGTGIVTAPNTDSIVNALETLMFDSSAYTKMSMQCREKVQALDWEVLYEKFVHFLDNDKKES